MTKITLLAAASVAAITFAGAAQAGTITGSVNGVATTAGATYTIAAERTDASTATGAGGFLATNTLTNALTVTANTTQTYRVVFTVTNGTIAASTLSVLNGGAAVAGSSVAAAGTTANSATFIVTVTAGGADATVTDFRLNTTLTSPSEATVSVASTTELLAGGVASSVDSTAATQLVRYVNAIGAFSATSNNVLAALPDFKTFTNSGVVTNPAPVTNTGPNNGRTAELATNYTYAGSVAGNSQVGGVGVFYASLASNAQVTRNDIIVGGTVVVSGSQLDSLTPSLSGVATAPVRTSSTATFTLPEGEAELLAAGTVDFLLTQTATLANQVVIAPGSFSTTSNLTYAAGFTSPGASASVPSGNIALDGVNFIAPWTAGSQAPNSTVIRLSNGGATPSGAVTLRLLNGQARAAGVTTGPGTPMAAATCTTTFVVPAGGELQLTKSQLDSCFGPFLRGDIQITVQSAATVLTAKARSVDASGATFEQSLGRFSGSTIEGARF